MSLDLQNFGNAMTTHQCAIFALIILIFDGLSTANIYLFKVNNRNTRERCEVCSKLTIKTPERRH